jgi:glycosyltransferase involved in cell wall biosynthesis
MRSVSDGFHIVGNFARQNSKNALRPTANTSVKIVHIITRFIPGGADENTLLTCNAQVRQGHAVVLISGAEWNPGIRSQLDPAVQFVVEPSLHRRIAPLNDIIALVRLRATLRTMEPDIVHTHTSKAGITGRLAARLAGVPTIVHGVHILAFRNMPVVMAWIYARLEQFCGAFTTLFIHVTREIQDECKRMGIGRASAHVVVESGMDVERFRSAAPADDVVRLVGKGTDGRPPFFILSLAALDKRKGLDRFLPVFRRIVDRRPNAVLVLAGIGDQEAELRAMVTALGLDKHVHFLGFRRDPDRLLKAANVLIICSEREGLPRVAVQAAIAGVPVVSTSLPGIDAIVRHGTSGLVVPLNRLYAMEEGIVSLIDDPAMCQRFARALRDIDVSAWNADTMTLRIAEAYDAVIGRSRNHNAPWKVQPEA